VLIPIRTQQELDRLQKIEADAFYLHSGIEILSANGEIILSKKDAETFYSFLTKAAVSAIKNPANAKEKREAVEFLGNLHTLPFRLH
jgi:hypothetical protein